MFWEEFCTDRQSHIVRQYHCKKRALKDDKPRTWSEKFTSEHCNSPLRESYRLHVWRISEPRDSLCTAVLGWVSLYYPQVKYCHSSQRTFHPESVKLTRTDKYLHQIEPRLKCWFCSYQLISDLLSVYRQSCSLLSAETGAVMLINLMSEFINWNLASELSTYDIICVLLHSGIGLFELTE
jgi:hypothetical protein